MDRLDGMRVLLAVADAGSLSAAARRLGIPLPTVSRKIAELESHLNARLLIRSTRSLALTDAGRSYVEAARRILEQIEEAERAAAGEYAAPRGDLVITAPLSFGRLHVTPVLAAFLAAYPQIDVRLALTDRVVRLLEDHVDCAVRLGALPDSSLMATRLGEMRRVVCASPAYLDSRGTPITPADLTSHASVTFDGLTSASVWSFADGDRQISVAVDSRLSVSSAEAAVDAAIAGVGLTNVFAYQAATALADGRLRIVLGDHEPPLAPVSLVHAGQGLMPLKLRAFLDFAAPRLRERLARVADQTEASAVSS